MFTKKNEVCPLEKAGSLDNWLRKKIQSPKKILDQYIKKGMTVLDIGCGPGFFSIEIANMVGKNGKVICADLQKGMLDLINKKIKSSILENRVILHHCEKNKIGIVEKVDFILAFYMVHEVKEKTSFFEEIKSILKPHGKILLIEPKFGHVSKKEFAQTINIGKNTGFIIKDGPKVAFSHSKILEFNK